MTPFLPARRGQAIAASLLSLVIATAPARAQEAQVPQVPHPLVEPHSVNRSGQIIIYATDSLLRGAVSSASDEIKPALLHLLGLHQDNWRIPIVLDLRRPPAGLPGEVRPSRLTLAQTGAGLKIQLELLLGEESRGVRLRDELVRALLLELAYRDRVDLPAGHAFTAPPEWLVEGCAACVQTLTDDGLSASLYAATLLNSGQSLPIEDFLRKDPAAMDTTSQAIYRAYAYGLVRLIAQEFPDGKSGLVAFLRGLPDSAGISDFDALRQHVTELAEPDGLSKCWAIGLDRLGVTQQAVNLLSVEETERNLSEILTIPAEGVMPKAPPARNPATRAEASSTYSIEEFKTFLKPGRGRKIRVENARLLSGPHGSLLLLEARAHPFYRPIVVAYEAILAQLLRGDTHKAAERLKDLAVLRSEVRTRSDAIADYLNWFEATQVKTTSGAFDDYLRSVEHPADLGPRRSDAVSGYLDGIESEYK